MPAERALYRGPIGLVAAFRSSIDDPVPADNPPYAWPLVVFPRTTLGVRMRAGLDEQVIGPTSVLFYEIGDKPLIRWVDTTDRCDFVVLRPDLYEAVTGWEFDRPPPARRVVEPAAATGMVVRRLVAALATRPTGPQAHTASTANTASTASTDQLAVEEAVFDAVGRAAAAARGHSGHNGHNGSHAAGRARRHRRALVNGVRELIGADPAARLGIDDLAKQVGAAPAHLARVYREEVGSTIHRYRTDVRLAHSLDMLQDDLTTVALSLGFASHSHFTASFRHRFGITPSQARASVAGQPGGRTDPWWTATWTSVVPPVPTSAKYR